MKLKNSVLSSQFSPFIALLLLSFFSRIIIAYSFGDHYIENEWKTIVDSLFYNQSYTFYDFHGHRLPCVFMPPMYPFFLYSIKIITFEKINFVNSIIFIQVILSTYSVYLFYKINKKIFSNKLSLINSFIFSFFPLNLYAAGQISSVSFQLFFSLLFIAYLMSLVDRQSKKNTILFSLASAILILTRGEFILIFIVTIIYLFYFTKLSLKLFMQIFLIVLLIVSPHLIRNYSTFNEIVIVKSLGFNLWKGNNQFSSVRGTLVSPPQNFDKPWKYLEKPEFKNLKQKLENIKIDDFYEINRDNIFLEEAINNIKQNSYRYFNLFLKKIFSYYFIDFNSNYPNYYNFFYLFPILIFSLLSFPGIFMVLKKNDSKLNYLLIYLFLNLIIFSVFFILPRYKLAIIPIQIILASYFVNYLYEKIFYKKQKV